MPNWTQRISRAAGARPQATLLCTRSARTRQTTARIPGSAGLPGSANRSRSTGSAHGQPGATTTRSRRIARRPPAADRRHTTSFPAGHRASAYRRPDALGGRGGSRRRELLVPPIVVTPPIAACPRSEGTASWLRPSIVALFDSTLCLVRYMVNRDAFVGCLLITGDDSRSVSPNGRR